MTELIHGDCLDVLRAMPDCSVDKALASSALNARPSM